MSKTSSAENPAAEEGLNETPKAAASQEDTRRYTLTRFLQVKKQRPGVAVLLRLNHGNEIHTIAEWENLVKEVLATPCNL